MVEMEVHSYNLQGQEMELSTLHVGLNALFGCSL